VRPMKKWRKTESRDAKPTIRSLLMALLGHRGPLRSCPLLSTADIEGASETDALGLERVPIESDRPSQCVIAGLDPAIHAAMTPPDMQQVSRQRQVSMDARVKPAHDEGKDSEEALYLKLSAAGELTFEDRDNFRAFKFVAEGDHNNLDQVRKAVAGTAELPDTETAWILEAALRQWPGVENDDAWQRNFSAMIEKGAATRLDRRHAQGHQGTYRVDSRSCAGLTRASMLTCHK